MSYEEKRKQHERQFERVEEAMTAAAEQHHQERKYGWCWYLGTPDWSWQQLSNVRPRTMRLF